MTGWQRRKKRIQEHWQRFSQNVYRWCALIVRPFIDFYYNYGLSRASVMSYVLCANLIIFVYLLCSITIILDPFSSPDSIRRLFELHFLWPVPEKVRIVKAPTDALFPWKSGDRVEVEEYSFALREYCSRHNTKPEDMQKEGILKTEEKFSITAKIGATLYNSIQDFKSARQEFPLWFGGISLLPIGILS